MITTSIMSLSLNISLRQHLTDIPPQFLCFHFHMPFIGSQLLCLYHTQKGVDLSFLHFLFIQLFLYITIYICVSFYFFQYNSILSSFLLLHKDCFCLGHWKSFEISVSLPCCHPFGLFDLFFVLSEHDFIFQITISSRPALYFLCQCSRISCFSKEFCFFFFNWEILGRNQDLNIAHIHYSECHYSKFCRIIFLFTQHT